MRKIVLVALIGLGVMLVMVYFGQNAPADTWLNHAGVWLRQAGERFVDAMAAWWGNPVSS